VWFYKKKAGRKLFWFPRQFVSMMIKLHCILNNKNNRHRCFGFLFLCMPSKAAKEIFQNEATCCTCIQHQWSLFSALISHLHSTRSPLCPTRMQSNYHRLYDESKHLSHSARKLFETGASRWEIISLWWARVLDLPFVYSELNREAGNKCGCGGERAQLKDSADSRRIIDAGAAELFNAWH